MPPLLEAETLVALSARRAWTGDRGDSGLAVTPATSKPRAAHSAMHVHEAMAANTLETRHSQSYWVIIGLWRGSRSEHNR